PGVATGVAFTNVLPAGLSFVSATSSQGTVGNVGGTVYGILGSLATGTNITVTVVMNTTATGTVIDSAIVTANEADTDALDNTATLTTTIGLPVADLALNVSYGPSPNVVGGTLTYSIGVVNNGPSPAANVVVSYPLPAGLAFVTGQVVSP